MHRSLPKLVSVLSVTLAAVACGPSEEERAAEAEATYTAAQADTMMLVESMYDPAAFDTIDWETPADRLDRGAFVWSFSCEKCHGASGVGDARFVLRGDTLQPPSFLAEDWRFADDPAALRKQIFTGTAEGMPHWGLYGLKFRDIEAVSTYILESLRGM